MITNGASNSAPHVHAIMTVDPNARRQEIGRSCGARVTRTHSQTYPKMEAKYAKHVLPPRKRQRVMHSETCERSKSELIPVTENRICSESGIVWAKLAGHPAWPARIVEREESEEYRNYLQFRKHDDDVCVRFYGTHDVAWLRKRNAVVPWKLGRIRKLHHVVKKRKSFAKALQEVRAFCNTHQRKGPPSYSSRESEVGGAWCVLSNWGVSNSFNE